MAGESHHQRLQALLRHPSLWRGDGAAAVAAGWSTGFAALDAALPGGGWPRRGLIEVLGCSAGHGELTLWAPLLRQLTQHETARCCALIAPPFEPFAPGWRAAGIQTDRLLVVRDSDPLWALEQSLLSGVCAIGFGWLDSRANLVALRRLALAAERGAALGVLIRPLRAALEHTPALLRLAVTRTAAGLSVQLLKGRGLAPRTVALGLA
ncbi:MAG TPA: translesion DNA synthesis-associated protein ImuA [Steroidobacteraceae bacterium]|nr:translesion DNA synthesis-associated protein ImuA [Steroidobacteraceae bacterium]